MAEKDSTTPPGRFQCPMCAENVGTIGPHGAERIAVLEEKMHALEKDVSALVPKVDQIHSVLMKASGAKYAVIVIATVIGFVIGIWTKLPPIHFK